MRARRERDLRNLRPQLNFPTSFDGYFVTDRVSRFEILKVSLILNLLWLRIFHLERFLRSGVLSLKLMFKNSCSTWDITQIGEEAGIFFSAKRMLGLKKFDKDTL